MLFKLSFSNMKKSLKDYAVYFFTLILGVAIFYLFNAIETQTTMLKISEDTREIVKLINTTLSGVSVFVAFILGFLVIYASNFLMKKRKKEFALYILLGMGKRKISLILFLETLIIGVISLGIGLMAGIGLSQVTSIFVANMFGVNIEKYRFVFSHQAFVKTLIYFAIIYVIVILFNMFCVNKYKLIDLLTGSRKAEKATNKNPYICAVVWIISVVLLAFAYYKVSDSRNLELVTDLAKYIVMGCAGTFLFFWSLSGIMFSAVHSMKKVYYKGLNSFVFRQMSSRMNSNVFAMTVICLMMFITICVLSSGLTVRNSLVHNIDMLSPADVQIEKELYSDDEAEVAFIKLMKPAMESPKDMQELAGRVNDLENQLSEALSKLQSGAYITKDMLDNMSLQSGGALGTGSRNDAVQEEKPVLRRNYDAVTDDIKQIAGQWSQIVASMDDALLMNLLKQADVTVTEDGNSLEIMVKSISGYNVISREETIAKIEELIEERTGISVRVVCTRIDEDEDFNRRYIALEELVGMDIEIDDKEEFI